ncbi:MAG: gluconolactonase [Bacteroidota bacterium]
MKNIALSLGLWIWVFIPVFGQNLPDIFKDTPRQIVPAATLAAFPPKTFLENLLLLPDGNMLVNSHFEGVVYKINSRGEKQKFASVKGKVTGIAAYGKHGFLLTGTDENDKAEVYLLDKKGAIRPLISLPEGQFLNGITQWSGDEFLIADSYKGCIWKINAKTKKAAIWVSDDLLKRGNVQNPTPAANGIKVFNKTVYISNTQQQQILSIAVMQGKPAKPQVFLSNVNIDDFTFDAAGNLYGATHVYNSILKITPKKQVTIIAEQPQGVSGSTACILRKNTKGYTLFVSTNGGMYLPPVTGIEDSKIITLQIQ